MAEKAELTPGQKKGCLIGCLAPIILIVIVLIVAAMIDAGNKKKKENLAEEKIEWVTVEKFKITDDLDLETKAMYTALNALDPNERVTNTGFPILEKESTLGARVEVKDVGEFSVFPKGTKSLTITMRSNRLDNDTKTFEDARRKTIKILNNVGPFMKENNISGIQIEWTLPSKLSNGGEIEPIYYILRFDIDTLLKLDWNTVTPESLESHAMYIG